MKYSPRVIKTAGQDVSKLKRLPVENRQFDEAWLQSLIFNHPELLPAGEINSSYRKLVPIGREISVLSGSIDNLYVTPEGRLCLVETKLWRNPEAHRTVLAQLIDYAKDLAAMDYEGLEHKVKQYFRSQNKEVKSLPELVKDSAVNMDEISFEAEVRRSLGAGDFLLLIVGDYIRPQVVMLSQAIQAAPHLEFNIGLMELSFYYLSDEEWPLLVVPSVVGRTHEVTRGVIRVRYEEKKPEVEVSMTDVSQQKDHSYTDMSTFLKSLPSDKEDVFRTYLDKWALGPAFVNWGKVGFSLRVLAGNKHKTVFDAYPTLISIFKKEWISNWAGGEHYYQKYRKSVDRVPAAVAIILSGRRYIRLSDISVEELELILYATDELTEALAVCEISIGEKPV